MENTMFPESFVPLLQCLSEHVRQFSDLLQKQIHGKFPLTSLAQTLHFVAGTCPIHQNQSEEE